MQEYYDRSMELLQGSIRAELFAAARPILAKEDDEASSYFAPGSRVNLEIDLIARYVERMQAWRNEQEGSPA